MFYVLTSHNIYALDRQFDTLSKEDTTVLINTLDKDYEKAVVDYCISKKIRHFVTPSDGTAATGKNTFLGQFEKDGIPYAVLIDGDDYLTSYGVKTYRDLAKKENAPDAVVLINPITKVWPKHVATSELFLDPARQHLDPRGLPVQMVQGSTVDNWEELKKGELIVDNYKGTQQVDLDSFQKYISLFHYGMGIDEIAARVTFMSRKALRIRYNKKFVVGEDTFQYLELKDLHDRGELQLVMHDESRPTYMYDARISGVAVYESQKDGGKGFVDWMLILKNAMEELKDEGRLHNTRLTEWLTA
jgi:hypothetical protein